VLDRAIGRCRKAANGDCCEQRDLLRLLVAFDLSADCVGERLPSDQSSGTP